MQERLVDLEAVRIHPPRRPPCTHAGRRDAVQDALEGLVGNLLHHLDRAHEVRAVDEDRTALAISVGGVETSVDDHCLPARDREPQRVSILDNFGNNAFLRREEVVVLTRRLQLPNLLIVQLLAEANALVLALLRDGASAKGLVNGALKLAVARDCCLTPAMDHQGIKARVGVIKVLGHVVANVEAILHHLLDRRQRLHDRQGKLTDRVLVQRRRHLVNDGDTCGDVGPCRDLLQHRDNLLDLLRFGHERGEEYVVIVADIGKHVAAERLARVDAPIEREHLCRTHRAHLCLAQLPAVLKHSEQLVTQDFVAELGYVPAHGIVAPATRTQRRQRVWRVAKELELAAQAGEREALGGVQGHPRLITNQPGQLP